MIELKKVEVYGGGIEDRLDLEGVYFRNLESMEGFRKVVRGLYGDGYEVWITYREVNKIS